MLKPHYSDPMVQGAASDQNRPISDSINTVSVRNELQFFSALDLVELPRSKREGEAKDTGGEDEDTNSGKCGLLHFAFSHLSEMAIIIIFRS